MADYKVVYGDNLTNTDTISTIDFSEEDLSNYSSTSDFLNTFFDDWLDNYHNNINTSRLSETALNYYLGSYEKIKAVVEHVRDSLLSYIETNLPDIRIIGYIQFGMFMNYGNYDGGVNISSGNIRIFYYNNYAEYTQYKSNWNSNAERTIFSASSTYDVNIKTNLLSCNISRGNVRLLYCNLPPVVTSSSNLTFNTGNPYQSGGYWYRGYFWDSGSPNNSSIIAGSCASIIGATSQAIYNPSGTDTSTSGKYPSGEMGGLGTFDDHTDIADISTKPSLNISDLGFFSIWNPTPSQLKSLADFVWNDPANWQQWGQIFQSGILKPLDYIISLSVLPVPSSALTLATRTFCMGGIVFDGRVTALGINLSMNQIEEQFVDINLGSLSLKEYFGSFLDYAPYSQVSIYLPFYGVAELSMNELQNADSIQLVYRINVLDGSCAIKLLVDRQTSAAQNGSVPLKHVLYEYYTNVKTDVPLTQGANTEHLKMAATMITAAVAMAAPIAGAGAAALAGGAGAAVGGSATMADILGSASASAAANGGKVASAIRTGAQGAQKMVNAMPSGGGMQRGNISGMSSGLLSERKPFLIVTRPIQVLPEQYKEEMGYTASIKTSMTDLASGFVKFDSIDLSSLDCEESERGQILDLLTNVGVYI